MIVIKTRYTLETYSKYYWFCLFRGKYHRYGQAFFLVVTLLVTAFSIWALFGQGDLLSKIMFPVMAVICFLLYLAKFMLPKRYVRRYPALFQADIEIAFTEEGFSTKQTGELLSGGATFKYEAVQKVYETRDAFYVYTAPSQALLLSRGDFAPQDQQALRELLQSKLPPHKYILCK